MAKKHGSKSSKKPSSSFFIILAIATVIGLPIAYNLTFSNSGQVAGIMVASQGQKGDGPDKQQEHPNPSITPKATVASLSFSGTNCTSAGTPGSASGSGRMMDRPPTGMLFFSSASYTCSDGSSGNLTPRGNASCSNMVELAILAMKACAAFPTPSVSVSPQVPKTMPHISSASASGGKPFFWPF